MEGEALPTQPRQERYKEQDWKNFCTQFAKPDPAKPVIVCVPFGAAVPRIPGCDVKVVHNATEVSNLN